MGKSDFEQSRQADQYSDAPIQRREGTSVLSQPLSLRSSARYVRHSRLLCDAQRSGSSHAVHCDLYTRRSQFLPSAWMSVGPEVDARTGSQIGNHRASGLSSADARGDSDET